MPGSSEIRVAQDQEGWATEAASLVHEIGAQAVRDHGRFSLALSGGTTPDRLYRTLVSPPFVDRFDWSRVIFFFSDERCVPPDHPESNYGLANRALLRPLNVPAAQVHRMMGEASDPEQAARDYEEQLRTTNQIASGLWPRIDLTLLGLGNDGHTASLFPGTTAVDECRRWVTVGHAPSGPPRRLTLTLGVINRSTVVVFLVTGAGKARIVKTILEPSTDADRRLPAALVKPEQGRLIWLLDPAASAELAESR